MGENEKAHPPTAQPVGEEANNEKAVVAPVSDTMNLKLTIITVK